MRKEKIVISVAISMVALCGVVFYYNNIIKKVDELPKSENYITPKTEQASKNDTEFVVSLPKYLPKEIEGVTEVESLFLNDSLKHGVQRIRLPEDKSIEITFPKDYLVKNNNPFTIEISNNEFLTAKIVTIKNSFTDYINIENGLLLLIEKDDNFKEFKIDKNPILLMSTDYLIIEGINIGGERSSCQKVDCAKGDDQIYPECKNGAERDDCNGYQHDAIIPFYFLKLNDDKYLLVYSNPILYREGLSISYLTLDSIVRNIKLNLPVE